MLTTQRKFAIIGGVATVAVAIIVAIVLAILFHNGTITSPFANTRQAKNLNIGQGVTVSGQAIPDKLKATSAKSNALPASFAKPDADGDGTPLFRRLALLEVGPYHGKLQAPMRVTIPIKGLVADKNNALVVMTRAAEAKVDDWTVLTPIDPATGKPRQPKTGETSVTVEMTHLSFLAVFNVFTEAIFKAVAYILESEVFKEAKAPKCPNSKKAKADRYALRKDGSDAILSCLDYDTTRKKYVVRVVNNRRYLLELSWSHAQILDDGDVALDLTELYKLRNEGVPLVRPREEALVELDSLKEGDTATVSSGLSQWGQSVDALGRISKALLEVVYGPATKGFNGIQETLMLMHEATDCANAIKGDSSDMPKLLKSCFGIDVLEKLFGSAMAILLTPVIAFMALADSARAVANAIGDRHNNRDRSMAVVTRQKRKTTAEALFGEWIRYQPTGETRGITFGGDFASVYFYNIPGCRSSGRCDFHASLSPDETPDGKIIARVDRVVYEVGGKSIKTPSTFDEDHLRVGDTLTLSVDEFGRAVVEYRGRFSDMNDLNGDGQIDDDNYYCTGTTVKSKMAVCGKQSWARF